VETLLNVVRGNSKSEATALLCAAYGFPLADASALAGLLAVYQGGNNLIPHFLFFPLLPVYSSFLSVFQPNNNQIQVRSVPSFNLIFSFSSV
jgi:hypothetical protein